MKKLLSVFLVLIMILSTFTTVTMAEVIQVYDDIDFEDGEVTKLEFTKVFNVKDFKDINLEIYLRPTEKDYLWKPEHSVTLKDINIKILGNS